MCGSSSAGEHDRQRIEPVDALGDLAIDRVDDLRAGGEEHLVAVVGRRVVRGRDDHAGGGVDAGDRPRQHRRRLHARDGASSGCPSRRAPAPCRTRTGRSCDGRRTRSPRRAARRPGSPRSPRRRAATARAPPPPGGPRAGSSASDRRRRRRGGRRCRTAAARRTGRRARRRPTHRQTAHRQTAHRADRPTARIGRGPLDQVGQFHGDVGIGLDRQPAVGGFEDRLVRIAVVVSHRVTSVRNSTSGRGPTWLITSAAAIDPRRPHE